MTETKRTEEPVLLRPHHGLCTAFFEGRGYSSGFTAHMERMIGLLRQEDPEVLLTVSGDCICSACPNLKERKKRDHVTDTELQREEREDGCTSLDKVQSFDRKVLELCGLNAGDRLCFSRFHSLIQEKILAAGRRGEVCRNCQWDDICSRKEREMFGSDVTSRS